MSFAPAKFAEKYLLAREAALKSHFKSGTSGFELEWNILDSDFKPVLTVGAGPDQQSFIDYLLAGVLPAWLADRAQREVFHWMIEWATHPYYSTVGAVYEGRLLEAALVNALAKASREFGERLYGFHGNLLYPAHVGHDSIPGGWHLAKRRYLQRCVELYGEALATAGIHANLSLPEPLLSWDFMHLPAGERGGEHRRHAIDARLRRALCRHHCRHAHAARRAGRKSHRRPHRRGLEPQLHVPESRDARHPQPVSLAPGLSARLV
jgi:hypothetical protein